MLCKETTAIFNGMTITRLGDNSYYLTQSDKLENPNPSTPESLVALRAKLQYVAGCVRPDLAGPVQLLAFDVREPTSDTYRLMTEINEYGCSTKTLGLRFVELNTSSLHLVTFTDAAFANAPGKSSQLGYVVVVTDHT